MVGIELNWGRKMLIAALGLVLVAASDPLPEGDDFGAALHLTSPVSLGSVLADPMAFTEAPVLLRARISDVCQRKGCWTILREGEQSVRVRFKDYGFFLPKEISGREALVEGVVTIRTLSQAQARHYAAEASGAQPKSIDGPQREIGFLATGVRVLPAPPDEGPDRGSEDAPAEVREGTPSASTMEPPIRLERTTGRLRDAGAFPVNEILRGDGRPVLIS